MDGDGIGPGSRSRELFERAKNIFPGGVNSPVRAFEPHPFFVTGAKGSRLYGADGEAYIDYCMAYGALLLGHAHPAVIDSVMAQLPKGTLYGAPTELEIRFGELIREAFPSMEMLRLANSGTEATMHAIRAARGFTGRKKIIMFEGCYHGAHDAVLVRAGSGAATFGVPASLGVPEEAAQNTIILPYNDIGALEGAIEREGDEIAAAIVEPVMGNAGLIPPKSEFLERLRRVTEAHGIVLIFDETITGFRLAIGGAQERYGLKADLTTLGKIIGGGFPIAAFGGRREIMESLSPVGRVYQAGTFSGNPASVAAGISVLQVLREAGGKAYQDLERGSRRLQVELTDLAADLRLGVQVHGIASMFQVFFTPHPVTDYSSAKLSDTKKFRAYFQGLLKQGIFIPPSQFETCFLSLAHTDDDLHRTAIAFEGALRAAADCR
ncbi:MAG: glutamate-1-semialdehyde 2,1-aminomutase [Candidatus Verstraetearchaeota archaeon]|nr:glutamate-1-semialdehyde 2,1-aminomutase [Candidatus Verstraetearchaeota archaeon]